MKKNVIALVVLAVLVFGLVISAVAVRQRQEIRKRADGEQQLDLYFAREVSSLPITEINVSTGEQFTLDIWLDAKSMGVNGLDISGTFSEGLIPLSAVPGRNAGGFDNELISTFDPQTRTVRASRVSTDTSESRIDGILHLARVSFRAPDTPMSGRLEFSRVQVTSPHLVDRWVDVNAQPFAFSVTAPTPTPSSSPSVTPTIATPTPTDIPRPTPTQTTQITPTPMIGGANLTVRLRFQGVSEGGRAAMVEIHLVGDNPDLGVIREVWFTPDGSGFYTGTIENISSLVPVGNVYTVFAKKEGYLRKRLAAIELVSGNNILNAQEVELLAGDLVNNGVVDLFDFNRFVEHFGPRMPQGGSPADFDLDGDVDLFDYNLFVPNYGKTAD